MSLLARGLSWEKYDIHLGLVTAANSGDGELPPWVTVHALDSKRARAGAFPLLRLVHQTAARRDSIRAQPRSVSLFFCFGPCSRRKSAFWYGRMGPSRPAWPLAMLRVTRAGCIACSIAVLTA